MIKTNQVTIDGRQYLLRFGKRSNDFPFGTVFITGEGSFLWWADGVTNPVVFEHKRKDFRPSFTSARPSVKGR